LKHQNNYVECLSVNNVARSFNFNLNDQRNYFDYSNKINFRFVFS